MLHSTLIVLQSPLFLFVSLRPCTLLLSSIQKNPCEYRFPSINISFNSSRKIYFLYFFCVNPLLSPFILTK
ncbi:hypothetical protein BJ875DRAFT_454277 [Amylocarpus encephaloides]|uniref:Uncharacterized protein n=1 Tax=Amylocarpus encephaloides TaxID=45428 RepID=A0A9P7YQI7_9HELO|nr:hypothetical protein BJ875DRAFT_454277 [Amylocarpus encephaloides]